MNSSTSSWGAGLTALLLAFLAGCRGNGAAEPRAVEPPPPEALPPSPRTGRNLEPPAVPGVDDIMQAKLLHTHGLLEAISLEGFERIEHDARMLVWLSEQSSWRVHETAAYAALSDHFRGVAERLSIHAAERDAGAVQDDYILLVESCTECHRYLRDEGLVRDMPGVVSWKPPAIGYPLSALCR